MLGTLTLDIDSKHHCWLLLHLGGWAGKENSLHHPPRVQTQLWWKMGER